MGEMVAIMMISVYELHLQSVVLVLHHLFTQLGNLVSDDLVDWNEDDDESNTCQA